VWDGAPPPFNFCRGLGAFVFGWSSFFVLNGLIAYIGKAAHIGRVSRLGSIRTPCDFDLLRPVTVMRCREMSGRNAEQPAEGF
jgi:hypothetical protein